MAYRYRPPLRPQGGIAHGIAQGIREGTANFERAQLTTREQQRREEDRRIAKELREEQAADRAHARGIRDFTSGVKRTQPMVSNTIAQRMQAVTSIGGEGERVGQVISGGLRGMPEPDPDYVEVPGVGFMRSHSAIGRETRESYGEEVTGDASDEALGQMHYSGTLGGFLTHGRERLASQERAGIAARGAELEEERITLARERLEIEEQRSILDRGARAAEGAAGREARAAEGEAGRTARAAEGEAQRAHEMDLATARLGLDADPTAAARARRLNTNEGMAALRQDYHSSQFKDLFHEKTEDGSLGRRHSLTEVADNISRYGMEYYTNPDFEKPAGAGTSTEMTDDQIETGVRGWIEQGLSEEDVISDAEHMGRPELVQLWRILKKQSSGS